MIGYLARVPCDTHQDKRTRNIQNQPESHASLPRRNRTEEWFKLPISRLFLPCRHRSVPITFTRNTRLSVNLPIPLASLAIATLLCGPSHAADPAAPTGTPASVSGISPTRVSPLHFRPESDNAGDAIPFYWRGQYHVFYLGSGGLKWGHIVSTDLTHWKELAPALSRGTDPLGPDGQDCWTGSVAERDGTFHLFYTGKNINDPKGDQKVMVATSKDLIHWEKQPDRTLYADGKIYWSKPVNGPADPVTPHHQGFRDPDVSWNEGEQQWWMILHALTADGHRPCLGLYTSRDLVEWTPRQPLGTYDMGVGLDCPNAAPMGGRSFIIASQAHYVSAETPAGPYPAEMKPYESGDLVVPKSLSDGKRRLVWGWIRDLEGSRDSGGGLWGGTLSLPREIYPGPEGKLYSRPAAEVTAAFTGTALKLPSPQPLPKDGKCSFKVPADYMLECAVRLDPKAILTVNLRQQENGAGYPLVIHPENQRVSLSRAKSNFSRKVELDATKPIKIQAFVQGSIIECFIDDRFAFTSRAYDFPEGDLGLKVEGGNAELLDLAVKTLPAPAP